MFEKWATFQPGIEYWMRGEIEDGEFAVGPAHYVGPTAIVQFGKIWWSTGAYVQVNHVHSPTPVADAEPYPFGPVWVRNHRRHQLLELARAPGHRGRLSRPISGVSNTEIEPAARARATWSRSGGIGSMCV